MEAARGLKMSNDEEDQISSLPDEILIHILSFLPTKYSFRTSLLSTRWINLFAFVPTIDFDTLPEDLDGRSVYPFLDFVDKFFKLYKSPQMTKFRFVTRHTFPTEPNVFDSWVLSAIKRNVRELDFCVDFDTFDEEPLSDIFSSETLSVLKLEGSFNLKLQRSAFLPCLKTLRLESVKFDESAQVIFLICPVLEDLYLGDCDLDDLEVLNITHSFLRKLQIVFCVSRGLELVLNTPSLVCFEYKFSLNSGVRGKSVSTSLAKAVIKPDGTCEQNYNFVAELLTAVSYVQHLYLSEPAMEAFGGSIEAMPTFHKLTRLQFEKVSRAAFDLLPNILDKCILLEVLIFDNGFYDDRFVRVESDINCYENVPSCVLMRLKEIEFRAFAMRKNEQKLVTYFLENARVLEKMTIKLKRGWSFWAKQSEFSKKLSTFPRSSRDCQIMIVDHIEDATMMIGSLLG